jgi:MFS family permease
MPHAAAEGGAGRGIARQSITAIGVGQCVNWGIVYYAFGVLIVPVERELAVPRWSVASAFSLALLVSAAAAPMVGRAVDRGSGPSAMQAGGLAAAALLMGWAVIPGLVTLYVVWAGLGLCMAAILYEPAFAMVSRALEDPQERLRALAAISVFGGLASTIFLPCTAGLVQALGWRGAVAVLAGVLAISTLGVSCLAFHRPGPSAWERRPPRGLASAAVERAASRPGSPSVSALLVLFSCVSFASTALTVNLIPSLIERNVTPTLAASLGGLLGVMQLPGRAFLLNRAVLPTPSRLLLGSLLMQAAGLSMLIPARSLLWVGAGISTFGFGAGIATLVRPHLVATYFSIDQTGHVNGLIARGQQLARAAGPVMAAVLAQVAGYGVVFGLLATLLAVLGLRWRGLPAS